MKEKIKIKIKVNGKTLSIEQNSTVVKLIKKLDIPLNKVAIELNKKIIDKKKLKKITLNDKDNLEIVHFIGGG
jgi:thiamine biosynthesis protein ThiS|tara:strand:+ start:47 stop:265 length:219 start_codon:yes stop_codon:yes gene_type:complete